MDDSSGTKIKIVNNGSGDMRIEKRDGGFLITVCDKDVRASNSDLHKNAGTYGSNKLNGPVVTVVKD